jgi:hypothetical protein
MSDTINMGNDMGIDMGMDMGMGMGIVDDKYILDFKGNDVNEILSKYKGYFKSESDLPQGQSLVGGEYAFVDDKDVGLFMFVYTPVRSKWVRDASVNFIDKSELDQGIMLKSYATLNPSQGDIRFRKSGHKTIVESFDVDDWKIVTTIGSVTTDTFNMESDEDKSMVGFNDIHKNRYSSLIKRRVGLNSFDDVSNEYGSLERQTILSSRSAVLQSLSTGGSLIVVNEGTSKQYPKGIYSFGFTPPSNIEFDTAKFEVKEPTKARMWIMADGTDISVYESQTRRDAIDSNGTLIIDDVTSATTGTITATFPRLGSMVGHRPYTIYMEIFEGVLLGNDNFISFTINGQGWEDSELTTNKYLEQRLGWDIALDNDMSYMIKGVETEDGAPWLKVARIEDRYGMVYGDERINTTIMSTSKIALFNPNDPRSSSYIASEEFARSNGSLEKVFNIEELEDNQVGLIIQTDPPTLTKWDDEPYPKYTQAQYLNSVNMDFRINTRHAVQHLILDKNGNGCSLFVRPEECRLDVGYYNKDDEFITDSIRLSDYTEVPEGHSYPPNRYVPKTRYEAETGQWAFSVFAFGDTVHFSLFDPNGGGWSIIKHDGASHIGEGSEFRIGEVNGERLSRLNNTFIQMKTTKDDSGDVVVVDNYIKGISQARLVTKFQGVPVDILDPIAIHKYADMSKDFHTFFSTSGLYRCFGMEENLPEGYVFGDNDFYVSVYTTSKNYKCLDVLDIRSGRKFIKTMRGGKWNNWVEVGGVGSVPLIPESVFLTRNPVKGTPEAIAFDTLGITKDDVLMVSCGNRGVAVKVSVIEDMNRYSASYFIDENLNELFYYIDVEGSSRCSLEIFKYSPPKITPPAPWHPKLTLHDVMGELSNATTMGESFYLDIGVISWELVRNPLVVLELPDGREEVPLIFDGKEKYYFEFPFDVDGRYSEYDIVIYRLIWDDQLGNRHEGTEEVHKQIHV